MTLGNKKVVNRIDFVDITFIVLMVVTWVFIANAWQDPLAATMLSVTVFISLFYLIARYVGVLQFLEVTRPTWTITALLFIVVWLGVFMLLPPPAGQYAPEKITPNMLEFFVSKTASTNFLQSWAFPVTESLFAGVLLAFFVGVGKIRALGNPRKQQLNIIAVILLISIIMSMLHVSIAARFAEAGVYSPAVTFGHQILSFALMLIAGVFLGMPALISSHVVKNLLVFGTPAMWTFAFTVFIILDILSIVFARNKERTQYARQLNRFIG